MRSAARRGMWATCACVLTLAATSLLNAAALPTPWINQDIGAVGVPGSASFANGVFTVKGAGSDIWGTADAFQALMQPIAGDVQIVARVTSVQGTNTYAKAGVMLRGSLAPDSAHVILDVRPNGSIEFMTRSADGGSTTYLGGATKSAPVWLKLTRTGTNVAAFVSSDGNAWSQVGTTTLSVAPTAYVGLVVTSHAATQLMTAKFDNVAVDGPVTLPAPWQNTDIGAVGLAGSGSAAGGVFTVKGAGSDIWGGADSFHAVQQTLAGDVQLVARVTSIQNTNTFAKAGLMLRDSAAADAAHVIIDLRPTGDIEFMTRSTTGGSTTWLTGAFKTAPVWLKLTRSVSLVTGYVSNDGISWSQVGTATVAYGPAPIAALVVTSHDVTQMNTATFDNVSAGPLAVVVQPPSAPSSPSPSSGATGIVAAPVALSWSSTGATSYDVNFGATNPPPQVAGGVTASSYVTSALQSGVTYYWQVVAKNSGGSTAGPMWSFTTVPPPPTIPNSPTPSNGATGLSVPVAVSWASSGASSYDVNLGTTNPPATFATGLSTPSAVLSNLQSGTTYYWQVVAKNGSGSSTSLVWSFTTALAPPSAPATPFPSSGASGVSSTSLSLAWSASGATSYDVYFGMSNPPPAVSTGLTTASYAVSNLQQGTMYYWQVVARNSGGSTAGAMWSFTTAAPAPGVPGSPMPSSGATGVQTPSATLSWIAAGATSYDVSFGTTNPPSQVAAGIATPSYVASNLQQGTTYYWQVNARNSTGSTAGPVWSFATVAAATSGVPSQYSAITDRAVRTKPPLPQLGAAGFTFNDPAFGSKVMRVTDGQTRPGMLNRSFRVPSNAHTAAWNATSTMFFIISNDGTIIPYRFNPSTMSASRLPSAPNENGGLTLGFYTEPQFSLVNPDVIYGGGGSNLRTILSYNFNTGTYSTVVNLDDLVGGLANTYLGSVTTGNVSNETLLTFFGGGVQDMHYYALLQPIAGGPTKLLNTVASTINGVTTSTPLNFHIHAMQIDKTGRYVFIYPSGADLGSPRFASQVYLWDTTTDAITALTPANHPGGHDAAGFGVWINQDCCTSSAWDAAQWQFRWLSAPLQTNDLISPILTPQEIYMADHTTWNNAQPDRLVPVISSTYRFGNNTAPWRAWDDEIIAIDTTNGVGGTVWRFAHHRSNVGSDSNPAQPYFWYEPIANISPDGKWVIFTSNWEKTLGTDSSEGTARQDVFLVQLTPQQ
ncbi:MAG TPA: fibronectin type III domain-containing protein [Vicinamibacterales bacterium]|nr:fibronectin type III domain-containing protein [Vicinamibacterales bacterium]